MYNNVNRCIYYFDLSIHWVGASAVQKSVQRGLGFIEKSGLPRAANNFVELLVLLVSWLSILKQEWFKKIDEYFCHNRSQTSSMHNWTAAQWA
jgi:hypothetical protein